MRETVRRNVVGLGEAQGKVLQADKLLACAGDDRAAERRFTHVSVEESGSRQVGKS